MVEGVTVDAELLDVKVLHDCFLLILRSWEGLRPPGRWLKALVEDYSVDLIGDELVELVVVKQDLDLIVVEVDLLNTLIEDQGALHYHGDRGLHAGLDGKQVVRAGFAGDVDEFGFLHGSNLLIIGRLYGWEGLRPPD